MFLKAESLSNISNHCLRAGMVLPFIAPAAFVLSSIFFSKVAITDDDMSRISFLRNQQHFLMNKNMAASLIDFRFFEIFILVAFIIAFSRILTALCARDVLDSYREKLINIKKAGRSTMGAIGTLLLIGPFAMFCSINFEFVSKLDQIRYLIEYFPKAFLCLETFMFSGGAIFSAELLLFFVWLLLSSRNAS